VLYDRVVGRHARNWRRFVEKHGETLIAFEEPLKSGVTRVRWAGQWNWAQGDAQYEYERFMIQQHLRRMLWRFLQLQDHKDQPIDEFINAYPRLPGNPLQWTGQPWIPLPRRGDLVRFIRRNPHLFKYDADTFRVCARLAPPPVNINEEDTSPPAVC
jgi:hypothetical protein